jgi:hypothetical protein
VLVGDRHGIQTAHLLEAGGEISGVEEEAGLTLLDQHAGMTEMSELHGNSIAAGGVAATVGPAP